MHTTENVPFIGMSTFTEHYKKQTQQNIENITNTDFEKRHSKIASVIYGKYKDKVKHKHTHIHTKLYTHTQQRTPRSSYTAEYINNGIKKREIYDQHIYHEHNWWTNIDTQLDNNHKTFNHPIKRMGPSRFELGDKKKDIIQSTYRVTYIKHNIGKESECPVVKYGLQRTCKHEGLQHCYYDENEYHDKKDMNGREEEVNETMEEVSKEILIQECSKNVNHCGTQTT